MWHHVSHNPKNVIFMDMETRLKRPPHIFGDFRFPPFRNDVFDCVIFDPPYYTRKEPEGWMFFNPEMKQTKYAKRATSPCNHWGCYKDKRELLTQIVKGQKALARVAKRMCFKWCEGKMTLWQVLSLFTEWTEIYRRNWTSTRNKYKKSKSSWVTLVRCLG